MKKLVVKFKKVLHIFFWEIDYTAFEVFNGITLFILGFAFWFFSSSHAVMRFTFDSPAQAIHLVSIFMVLFGISKMVAISQKSLVLRKWLALVGTFIWGFLFAIFSTPPIKPTSVIFITILTAFSMWAYIRLVLHHRGKRFLDPRDPYNNP